MTIANEATKGAVLKAAEGLNTSRVIQLDSSLRGRSKSQLVIIIVRF